MDTEDVVQWRSISKEGVNQNWKELCGRIEEEVVEKDHVEDAKKSAKGRGEPLEWRIVKKEKNVSLENDVKIVGQEFSHGSENTACNEAKVCRQAEQERKGANRSKAEWTRPMVRGSVNCSKSVASRRRTQCSDGTAGCMKRRRMRKRGKKNTRALSAV